MAGVVVLLSSCAVLTGCGSNTVTVDRYDVPAAARPGCATLLKALPERVAGQKRRDVDGSTYAAAWGDPAIVLRCGVALPGGYTRTSECQSVNGIDWYVPHSASNDQDAEVHLTLVHRSVVVGVTVPAKLRPPDAVMVDLGLVVAKRTRARGHCV